MDKWRIINNAKKRRILTIMYLAVLILVCGVIGFNYQPPASQDVNGNLQLSSNQNALIGISSESNLAITVAEVANLSVLNNVMERSISLVTKEEMAQNDDKVISKPILSIDDSNNAVTIYTTVDGDTVPSIASKFDISTQTIKWANNLLSDTIGSDSMLVVPIVDGVVYTMKDGDELNVIVNKYKGTISSVLSINNISEKSVKTGDMIVIPGGILPQDEQPGYSTTPVATSATSINSRSNTSYFGDGAVMAGNRYAYGYCTWYAYNRRAALGRSIGSFWGNANTWDDRARAAGWTVNYTPIAGAIFQTDAGYYGHVGIVESVNSDGTINISDMNGIAGWNRVGYSNGVNAAGYIFIY